MIQIYIFIVAAIKTTQRVGYTTLKRHKILKYLLFSLIFAININNYNFYYARRN